MKTIHLIKFLILFYLLHCSSTFANYVVDKVYVNCGNSEICKKFNKSFSRLQGSFDSEEHFQLVIREYLADMGYEKLSFEVVEDKEGKGHELHLTIVPQKYIEEVNVYLNGVKETLGLVDLLSSKSDSFLDEENIKNDMTQINNRLSQLGYSNVTSKFFLEEIRAGIVRLVFRAEFKGSINVKSISYNCKNNFINEILQNSFSIYQSKPFVKDYIQQEITLLRKSLMEQGFYQLEINHQSEIVNDEVSLVFNCKNDQLVVVEFKDEDDILMWEKVYPEIRSIIYRVDRQFVVKELTQFLENKYISRGRKAIVKISEQIGHDVNKEKIQYKIFVKSSVRTRASEILFRGNSVIDHSELMELYYKNATDLAKNGYVDEEYYAHLVEIIKKRYLELGHLGSNVYYLTRDDVKNDSSSKPVERSRISYPKKTIIFDISEGTKTLVTSFDLFYQGGRNDAIEQLKDEVFNLKASSPFNPIKFENDMSIFLQILKDRGYFDAHYIDTGNSVVSFNRNAQLVSISLNMHLGPIYRVRNLFVVGLNKTLEYVVSRKVDLKSGSLLTPQLLSDIQSDVANLGLFKSYDVKVLDYIGENNFRDIIVHVQEKEFGSVEVAPGYRTDLGLRLAAKVSYNNLFGKNHSASTEIELNNRLSNSDLDPTRSSNLGSMLEYEGRLNYNMPDIFKSYWDYNITLSSARRRLYSFDAEIQRLSNTFNHDFSRRLNFSLRHQLEIINQFNAVQELNDGSFRIGSLTPSLTLDHRNDSAYTTKGYLLNASYELAKPEFYSSDSNGYEIDFYKFVSRNRFYIPIGEEFSFAFSLTFGIQENLRNDTFVDAYGNAVPGIKKGFIPSIKVFRLSGIDTVRGFSEEEINKLPSGDDITSKLVQGKVYMTNIKVEPRYRWTDDMVLGLFWDAGKIQFDNFDTNDLRSSVGMSLKYITPVGTLDFDYGFKLLRKRYPDGTLESPGRIHISIGFF